MSGNYTNLEQTSRLTINITVFNVLATLCHGLTVNIQNVLMWLECRHEDVCATD